jgi:predicted RNA-binding protein with PIN domain
VEILFSSDGKTADDMIERATHRLKAYGDVLAVTDDRLERDTVTGLGGHVASCQNFIRMVENALAELKEDLKQYNRAERTRYRQKR